MYYLVSKLVHSTLNLRLTMGFIILTSENKDFSYVIRKNPATSPHIRKVRKGFCLGKFHEKSYVMRFIDEIDEISFPKHKSDTHDYLPYMQYCAPILMTCCCKEMLGTAMNQNNEMDIATYNKIEQGIIKLSPKAVNLIKKINTFITNYKIDVTDIDSVKGLYAISISSIDTQINELLQFCYFVGYTLHCMTFGYGEKPDKHGLDKIIKIMNNVKVPYYIRYLYKIYMIAKEDFIRVKKELEGSDDVVMLFGNTQTQRYDCIAQHVTDFCDQCKINGKNIHIVDIGCGEGYYVKSLLKLMKKNNYQVQYHAHDIDPDEMQKIKTLKNNDEIYALLQCYDTLDQLVQKIKQNTVDDHVMIIFTEVVEHIPVDEVENFMINLIKLIDFKKMLITTPDYTFNQHYSKEPGELRDLDHKQEFTRKRFCDFMDQVLVKTGLGENLRTTYLMIGDCVQGISMSQGMCITSL